MAPAVMPAKEAGAKYSQKYRIVSVGYIYRRPNVSQHVYGHGDVQKKTARKTHGINVSTYQYVDADFVHSYEKNFANVWNKAAD